MIREKSCGAVVFTKTGNDIKYLLVQNLDGIYGFPKGHMESDETEAETALREVFEETNIEIELIDGFRKIDEYSVPKKDDVIKQVVHFLGEFQNQNVIYQSEFKDVLSDLTPDQIDFIFKFIKDYKITLRKSKDNYD